MDCNSISYSYSIVSTPFKETELCSKTGKDSIFEEFYNNPFPPSFMTKARTYFYNESSKPSDLCRKYLPYRAEVNFRLATDTVSVLVRTRRLSFFDKLSAFGNHIQKHKPILVASLIYIFTIRGYPGPLHWDKYSQRGRGYFLAYQVLREEKQII